MMELTRLQYIESGICPHCKKRALAKSKKHCEHCLKIKRRNARKHSKRRREKYLDQGICPSCRTNSLEPDKTRCSTCLEKEAIRVNKKRKKRDKKTCYRCLSKSVSDGYKICDSCREYDRQKTRDRRAERIRAGLCPECGQKLDDSNYKSCSQCRAKSLEQTKALYYKRKAQGLCTNCGNKREEHTPSSILCVSCWSKSRARRRKSHSKNSFGGHLEAIIERDKGCVICKRPYGVRKNSVVCHHIDGNRSHNTPENLILLCRRCHGAVEGWKALSESNRSQMLRLFLKYYPYN